MRKKLLAATGVIIVVAGLLVGLAIRQNKQKIKIVEIPSPIPSPSLIPSPTPSPSPLSFEEMNRLYGPCVYAPTLMYHHVAPGAANLTVATDMFRKQMEYLRDRGYTTVSPAEINSFFDSGQGLPRKAVLLTFDDGYGDFYSDALPILREFGFKATVFIATGLVNNPGYLTWDQIKDMNNSGLITLGNHTWSHNNLGGAREKVEEEIGLADKQLIDNGVLKTKVIAYPYGSAWNLAVKVAVEKGYGLGFSTVPGGTLCRQQRLGLPRIRIGNSGLGAYGL